MNKILKYFQRFNKVDQNEDPKPTIEKIDESIPRTEILADGFVYEYPYTIEGARVLPDNLRKAVQFYLAAKTDQERRDRSQLLRQVSNMEAKLATDSVVERINREVAEKMKSK